MSKLTCKKCGNSWDGRDQPECPNCLAKDWAASPNIIKPKHDPTYLPYASKRFRSVVPNELVEQPTLYFQSIANSGTALYSKKHNGYCYVSGVPEYMTPGSAIPGGSAMPTYPMDAFRVADPFGNSPHIFAEDVTIIRSYISDGEFAFLPRCSVAGCDNCQIPGTTLCVAHTNPPKAEETSSK